MKTLIIISFLLIALACQQPNRETRSGKGHTLVINDLKYSAYSWYYPNGQWEFYLDYYVHIDKSGHFVLMSRDSLMSKPKYLEGIINDTLRSSIDKLFLVDTMKEDYKSSELLNIAYDGFTYCIDIKKDTSTKKIVFIQNHSPANLRKLSSLLDKLVLSTNTATIDTIDISEYSKELQRFSFASLGPPPKQVAPKMWTPAKVSK